MPPVTIGWLVALLVLVVAAVLWISGHAFDRDLAYAFICALALSRLIP
jgi:hypothetical protein